LDERNFVSYLVQLAAGIRFIEQHKSRRRKRRL
jgi:hypothetical protein